MDFINLVKLIDNGKGNYILIILNNNFINANFNDTLKFKNYQIYDTNIITFDSIYNQNTIIQVLQNGGMIRGIDYILWEKILYA